jgi:hypothetical protein
MNWLCASTVWGMASSRLSHLGGAMPVLFGTTIHTDILIKSHPAQAVSGCARTTRLVAVQAIRKVGASGG